MKSGMMILVLICLLATAPAAQAAKLKLPEGTLKSKELREIFTDRTVNTITANQGLLAVAYYAPSGEIRQLRKGETHKGTWRITDSGRLCIQMDGYREKCRIVVREGATYKKYVVKKNGQHQHTLTYLGFSDGNPYGL